MRPHYGPAIALALAGLTLLAVGITAPDDGATIAGIVLGSITLGSAVPAAAAIRTRRHRQRAWGLGSMLSDRDIDRMHRTRDRSHEPPVAPRTWLDGDPYR